MTEEKIQDQRVLVESFKENSAVCEVWESRSRDGVRIYFDVRLSREFVSAGGERKRGPFIQQRDIPDLMIATIRAQQYIAKRHAEIRRSRNVDEYGDDVEVGN